MDADALLPRAAVVAVAFALALVVGAAVTGGGATTAPSVQELSVPAYEGPDAVAEVPAETGAVELTADAEDKVIVIDAGHGGGPDAAELEPLVTTLTRNGAQVEFYGGEGREAGLNASLRRADAFVAFGAERRYTAGERAGLERFAEDGGRVLLLHEPQRSTRAFRFVVIGRSGDEGVPAPMTELASRFGLAFGNGYLYDMESYDTNYRNVYARPTGAGDLGEGVDRLVLHESRPVLGGESLLETRESTELSETRQRGPYPVAARSGNVVAVGDASVLSQDFYRRADNEAFVGNLLDFLVSGEKDPDNAPAPEDDEPERPPRPTPPVPREAR